jgi:ABC-type nickel/cobalt efflux system permease component RcnA
VSTLTGLVVFALTGAGWVDAVAGFVIAAFAIHEGREAWEGELAHDHSQGHDHEHDTKHDHDTDHGKAAVDG